MGQQPRPKPKHLATKLLAIRQRLGVSQVRNGSLAGFSFNECARLGI